jgi:hypothetical protein
VSTVIGPRPLVRRRGPIRPEAPNSKGLRDPVTLPVKFEKAALVRLRTRAEYETVRWRLAHGGRGREISAQDIVRRLVDQLDATSPLPKDAVSAYLRRQR